MRRRSLLALVAGLVGGGAGCARRHPDVPRSAPQGPADGGGRGGGSGDPSTPTATPQILQFGDSGFVERDGEAILQVVAENTASESKRFVVVAPVDIDGQRQRFQTDVSFEAGEQREIEIETGAAWEDFRQNLHGLEAHEVVYTPGK